MAEWPYSTARWQRLRAVKLSQSTLCEMCAEEGRITPADHVDHVTPVSQGGDAFPPLEGLRSLCHSCHSRKTWHVDRAGGRVPVRGVDPLTGKPLDPADWWNSGVEPGKSLGAESRRTVCIVSDRVSSPRRGRR